MWWRTYISTAPPRDAGGTHRRCNLLYLEPDTCERPEGLKVCIAHGGRPASPWGASTGADRVVLGSDWPFVPWDPSPVAWVQGLQTLTPDEKEKILWRNLESAAPSRR
ncbi:MAG TPA: amidohydrolase family protein [Methylomirabilota bacterium]|nr:amidohydrolase family protein [Methylomirabilota bacterium]